MPALWWSWICRCT